MVNASSGLFVNIITGLSWSSIGLLGWFGPRGVASILFGLLMLEEIGDGAYPAIWNTVMFTVCVSVFAHGMTAVPFTKLYARHCSALERHEPEMKDVSAMPLRRDRASKK